jgi:beta-glucanase (GH16 family)
VGRPGGPTIEGVPRRPLLLAIAVAIASLLAVTPAGAAAAGFTDDFSALDRARWLVGDHTLGRSHVDPANVSVAGGALALGVPGLDGAEVRSASTYGPGTFRARLKAAAAPSSLTGFFLYAPPDYASEVDIEILNDATGTVLLSTYAGGAQTHTETRSLGFDPTAAFHTYEIALDHKAVTFSVDGVALRTWRTDVPKAAMPLYLNAWYPRWLTGTPGPDGAATLVDSVTVAAR